VGCHRQAWQSGKGGKPGQSTTSLGSYEKGNVNENEKHTGGGMGGKKRMILWGGNVKELRWKLKRGQSSGQGGRGA